MILTRLDHNMDTTQPNKRFLRPAWAFTILSGLLLLFIGLALVLTYYPPPSSSSNEKPTDSKNPTLVLANGSAIPVIIPPAAINRSYDLDSLVEEQADEKTGICKGWTEFTVPPGHVPVPVKFSDGSRVELNAGTTLRFPTCFSGDKREVFLKGEAYFNVMHDAQRRFIVHAGEVDVKVIGTIFNINAYTQKIQVSLLSGGVLVSSKEEEKQLVPGQAAIFDGISKKLSVDPSFDKEQVISWRQGVYLFCNRSLGDVCEVAFRMYGIKLTVPKALASEVISGHIDRKQNINYFLESIDITNGIKPSYDKEGRITLTKPARTPK